VNAATVLVERLQKEPVAKEDVKQVIEDSLNDHICRCTGYVRYYSAVHDVVMNTPGLVK
jgi:aerobic-type carbon monoxide dehydrogenase small subunit (CoxS/CutS family)